MDATCYICQRPKGIFTCGTCEKPVCKACSQKLKAGRFAFLDNVPADLTHPLYCGFCYDGKVAPALENYEATMERAKGVCVFFKHQSAESRHFSRLEKPIKLEGTVDRDETLMRLAFRAVQAGFNALLDVELDSVKVRNEGYQTTRWHAKGIPSNLDVARLEREEGFAKVLLPYRP